MGLTRLKSFGKLSLATLLLALLGYLPASAITYTVATSGNYSSNTTWAGGIAPSGTITNDIILVPAGVTLTLDQNVVFNGVTAVLNVAGTLTAATGNSLVMTNGIFTGNGTLTVDSMVLSLTSGFTFTGNLTANTLYSTGAAMGSAATILVKNTLRLAGGSFTLNAGNISVSNNATIILGGGVLRTAGTGTASLTNTYNVRYLGNSNLLSGPELQGSGLNNVDIAMGAANDVSLAGDVVVKGMMTLTSGYLRLNGRNLTFSTNGDFSASGTGSIVSAGNSRLTLNSALTFNGGLRFRADSNTVKNLVVNMRSATAVAKLSSQLNVTDTLTLQRGKLNIDTNLLALTGNVNNAISGGSDSSYVITMGNGRLGMNILPSTIGTYHVGTAANYAPAGVSGNAGNASGMIGVGVLDSVRASGNTGAALSATRKMVNATWFVSSANSTNIDINLTTVWNANMEVNGFKRNQVYISHYTAGAWDTVAGKPATAYANGTFSVTRNNITSLSPFAVMDRDSALGIQNTTMVTNVTVYPNPATNTLKIESSRNVKTAGIYSTTGLLIKSARLNDNTISIGDLPAGNYFILFETKEGVGRGTFTKL